MAANGEPTAATAAATTAEDDDDNNNNNKINNNDDDKTDAYTSSIDITTRTERSRRMFLLQHSIKPFSKHVIKPRKIFPPGSPQLQPPKKLLKKCAFNERKVEDIYIYDFAPKSSPQAQRGALAQTARAKRIYYFAGGGWQMPASSEHWALVTQMALHLPHTVVSLISYPLAPNSPASSCFDQLMALYHSLLTTAAAADEDVVLAGDSAGGNIVLCLALEALRQDPEHAPVPAAILAMCPSTDLRRHNPQIRVLEKHDPLLRIPFINATARAWCGEWDAGDVRVSPINADVAPLAARGVRVHGITARYDILSPDGLLFREKCAAAGVRGEWLDWDKQMHCFPVAFAFGFPESVQAKDWILDVLRRT